MSSLSRIVNLCKEHADPTISIAMSKYMRNKFPFLGIPSPKRTEITKEWIKNESMPKLYIDEPLIRGLWALDEREYQYIALDILIKNKKACKPEHINLCEYLLTTNCWWDTIDGLASHFLGELVLQYPEIIDTHIKQWTHEHDNMWIRRSTIIYQLKYKQNTNTNILEETILANHQTDEFFLNKAIGWSLREYSKTNKQFVKEFLITHQLHKLSVREASKYLK